MANELPTPEFEAPTLISQKKNDVEKKATSAVIITDSG